MWSMPWPLTIRSGEFGHHVTTACMFMSHHAGTRSPRGPLTRRPKYDLSYHDGPLMHCIQLWDAETGKCFHTFRGHTAEIVRMSQSSKLALSSRSAGVPDL